MLDEDGYDQRENENVQRACVTLVNAYAHVCSLLASHVDLFIDNGDPRYIRSLLTQLYNSIMELRVTCTQVAPDPASSLDHNNNSSNNNINHSGYRRTASRATINDTIRPHSREPSATPTADRLNLLSSRPRNGTFTHNPSNLRVATDVAVPVAFLHGTGRTATITSAATPRSGESFASGSNTSSGRALDFSDEDRLFERIFLSLQRSSELISRTLPALNAQFAGALRNAISQRAPEQSIKWWKALVVECGTTLAQCETLKTRLSLIKLKEPGIRTQTSFWSLCQNFLDSWANLILLFKDAMPNVPLPVDIRTRLRPIQQAVKETTGLMVSSPWADFVRQGSPNHPSERERAVTSPFSPNGSSGNGSAFAMLPMTPQSAALGPAVQATVPSTPQSAAFAAAFSGGVFERADALMASMGTARRVEGSGSGSGSFSMRDPGGDVLSPGLGGGVGGMSMNGNGGMMPLPLPLRINGDGRERGKVAF
jgi:hypothetical protein